MKKYGISVFVFRNDLRLQDNIALISALKNSKIVIPVYIQENLDLFKIKNDNNKQFLLESIEILDNELNKKKSKLIILKTVTNLKTLILKNQIEAIFINKLYHPFHIKQEKQLEKMCGTLKIALTIFQDFLLHEALSITTNSGTAYKVYTPFFNKAKKQKVESSLRSNHKNYLSKRSKIKAVKIISIKKLFSSLKKINENLHKNGGLNQGEKILQDISKFKDYKKQRDFPALQATTKLSAYINSGCVSIRQVYHAIVKKLGNNHELIRQIYWREFYYNLYYAYPELFKKTLKKPKVKWIGSRSLFNKWKKGKTGVLIVDAAMQQINQTGFMHNRCRMIVANFLTLRMKINWKWGEKYFAQNLTDYDPILNNGNWQYMAQVGTDTAGYLRVLNPKLQQKKYDKDCKYIKKWLPKEDYCG
ncbi:deoxyribodipyrimidine photo-lyase [Candidatus Dependentiae bacterium]|nr:deoxyribodipyrimidine photo-lyase [Candidatus Dependentiae bacterium]